MKSPKHRRQQPATLDVRTRQQEMQEMARRAWQERGIAILWPDRIKDAWDRQHVLNIARAQYGERRAQP